MTDTLSKIGGPTMSRLFGTDGIRGIAGEELTAKLARDVGMALTGLLNKGNGVRVLIGMDTRDSSEWICDSIADGIASAGGNAEIVGVCSTPAVAYLVKKHGFDAGVMISASHNPYQYNGIKIFASDGFKLSDALEDEIEGCIGKTATSETAGSITKFDGAIDEYTEYLVNSFGKSLSGIRVAVDCANGSASVTAERALSALGAECVVICDSPNGTNINDGCGSTHLEKLRELVTNGDFDLGIAFDGDADRCLAIDKNGNLIDGDYIMAILGLWMGEQGKLQNNAIVGTVMSNLGLIKFCEENNIDFISTKVGDRYVLERMNMCGYNLGGEQSGHIILRDLSTTGDGQLTAIALLSRIKESGKDLTDLAAVMKKYPQYMVNIKADSREKELFKKDEVILDLIKETESMLNGGRLVIRPSGTEHLIRIMAEGEDISTITKLCDSLGEKITERLAELKSSVGE